MRNPVLAAGLVLTEQWECNARAKTEQRGHLYHVSAGALAATPDTISALVRVGAVAAWAFPVAGIRRSENLLQSGVSVVTSPGTTHQNVATYVASVAAVGQTVTTYQNIADAFVTFPRDAS